MLHWIVHFHKDKTLTIFLAFNNYSHEALTALLWLMLHSCNVGRIGRTEKPPDFWELSRIIPRQLPPLLAL